ncbi:protein croquemort-like [Arctopsyche grandis]|uniref:protein croquemort-like n=1 Tax=Arctopsyche grandis TaxID=121162 RepID=UPI00406D9436
MACCSKKCQLAFFFGCGSFLLIACIILLVLWPAIFLSMLKSQLVLTNSSKSYEMWRETPIPMYLELFLYNLSNADEVTANPNNVKPHFNEMGPYVFSEHHLKVNETWHPNGTISFLQRRTWVFHQNMSNGLLSDKITNVNVIGIIVGHFVRNLPRAIRTLVNSFLVFESEKVIITKTAGELLFEGYEDKIINIVNDLNKTLINIPYKKFGWFAERNESDTFDGLMSIFTGADDINKLGLMDLWNLDERVNSYEGDCGLVKGGTGELFPPQYDPDNVTVFSTDVCSAITLKRSGDTTIHGITGSLYVGDDSVFDDGVKYPENACFCLKGRNCAPAGTRDVSRCKLGAPAFVSFPHFYLADPVYTSKLDGIKPNKENDEFRMGLEVFTGIPLLVRAQLQINLHVTRIPGMSFFNKLPDDIYMPMLWFRQEVVLTEEYASQAKLALLVPQIVEGVLYAILVIGAILISIGALHAVKMSRQQVESQVLLRSDTS